MLVVRQRVKDSLPALRGGAPELSALRWVAHQPHTVELNYQEDLRAFRLALRRPPLRAARLSFTR
jgi:hypothetical protein